MIMYARNDKRRLYWLMDMLLSGQMGASVFCDEFYYSYSLEIDRDNVFDAREHEAFGRIDQVSSRFSQYEADLSLDSRAFIGEAKLKETVAQVRANLG